MIVFFYVPVPSLEEAKKITRIVIQEGLAACGNLHGPVISIYEWKEELHEEQEVVLILKTTPEHTKHLRSRICELHSYECPCVASWEADSTLPFADWVKDQTR